MTSTTTTTTTTTAASNKTAGRVLLPSHVIPTKYNLQIVPNFNTFTFTGVVHITMTVAGTNKAAGISAEDEEEWSKKIQLHAKELTFTKASYQVVTKGDDDDVDGEGDGPTAAAATIVEADEIHMNLKTTIVTFCFPTSLPKPSSTNTDNPTTILLSITYQGCLNNQMAGFYRSTYKDFQGKEKIVASTQFEALDARRAFPCVDEPAVKATFIVQLTVPSHLTCFSNMPEESRISTTTTSTTNSSNDDDDTVIITFMESPKMSTYLVAFCIGEFDFIQTQTKHGVLIKVYTPRGRSHTGKFSLDCAAKCLDAYDDFFQIPYPLPKLDMVAIPEFAMGAMENWGLVTYRDVDLLIDPITASNKQKQRVCSVVCHELAHQWFGNLVTMAWWDDLWLNEGFASWAENWGSDVLFPHYQMWDQCVTDQLGRALKLDSLLSSHPIQVPIAHAEEVEQVFDGISYAKGGSVVRMMRAVLGFQAFQDGLSQYMKDHAYGNTETFDLWQAWEKSSGMPVQELMASWTEQMGFPIVKVIDETWSDDKVVLTCEQSWFLSDGSEPPAGGNLWTIPILTCTAAGTQADVTMMREKTATVTIPIPGGNSSGGWIKLNAGQEVPMRVQYTPSLLAKLSSHAIPTKELSPADRVGLIGDAYAMVKAGSMKPEELIKLLASYDGEDNCVVWQGLSEVLGGLETILSDDEVIYKHFVKFARTLVMPLVDLVGWEDTNKETTTTKSADEPEDHLGPILRGIMISLLSTFCYDDPDVIKEAKTRCESFLEDPEANAASLPTDMKPPVFGIYLKSGGQAEYDAIKSYYYVAKDNSERKQVLSTLGRTADAKLKLATMDWSCSGEIKIQDFFYAMGSVGQSGKLGRDVSWTYLQDNFTKIQTMLSSASPSLMNAVIVFCAGGFSSVAKADEIDAFFKEHPLPNNTKRIAQLTENMRANGKFLSILQGSNLSQEEFWNALK